MRIGCLDLSHRFGIAGGLVCGLLGGLGCCRLRVRIMGVLGRCGMCRAVIIMLGIGRHQ